MANTLYPTGRQKFLAGDLDWDAHDIKVVLLSSTYTYSDSHEFHSDLSGVLATSGNLASKTVTNGYADAADVTFASVAGGSTVVAIAVYRDTGVSATSPLIYFADTTSTGVPISIATDGGNITITWPSLGIFRL